MNTQKSIFDVIDKNFSCLLTTERKKMSTIYSKPISNPEYSDALKYVCNKHNSKTETWSDIMEATNLVIDKRRQASSIKPIFSESLGDSYVIVNASPSKTTSDEIILPKKLALICEYQMENKNWKTDIVAVMKTVDDFWTIINMLDGNTYAMSKFSLPLEGKENDAQNIFSNLIKFGRRGNGNDDDVFDVDGKFKNNVNNIVSSYNALHPIWSFVQIEDNVMRTDTITVPFIRIKDRAANDITINVKDTRANHDNGIHIIGNNFTEGFLPTLIFAFIGGNFPDNVSSVVFSRTIAVDGTKYFRGIRIRVLVKTTDRNQLENCMKYLKEFIEKCSKKDCNYNKCIVKISLPVVVK